MLTNEIKGQVAKLRTKTQCNELARKLAPRGEIGRMTEEMYTFLQEVEAKREARRQARWTHPTLSLDYRLNMRLLNIATTEVRRRRLATPTCSPADDEAKITDYRPATGLWVVNVDKWYHYSNRYGDRHVNASWLCGRDDDQYFAVRVPGTLTSVAEALDYITPAEVRKARDEGRWVGRQGDVYLVELKAGRDNLRRLPRRHSWNAETRTLEHPQHAAVQVPAEVRAVKALSQTQLTSTSTSTGRFAAD